MDQSRENAFTIVPRPQRVNRLDGTFCAKQVCIAGIDGLARAMIVDAFAAFEIPQRHQGEANIRFARDAKLPSEGYRLCIAPEGITVCFSDQGGAFYAAQTLSQIISREIPCAEIEDFPSLPLRGYQLDVSRGRIPTMDTFYKIINLLARLKYNQFYLYLDDFVFAYPGFEAYWKDKDPITVPELRQIQTWCSERQIALSICQNTFGHMENFLKQADFFHLANGRDDGSVGSDLNPLDPGSLALVDRIFEGLLPLIDSDFIHIGCDETVCIGEGKTKARVLQDGGKMPVYIEFLEKVYRLASKKYGKRVLFSADMVLQEPESLATLPNGIIPCDWGYEAEHPPYLFDDHADLFRAAKLDFVTMPSTCTFCSFTGRTDNMVKNIHQACRTARQKNGLGSILSTWGDGGNPTFWPNEYPGIAWHGCCCWNLDKADFADALGFLDRLVFYPQTGRFADLVAEAANSYVYEHGKFPNQAASSMVFSRVFEDDELGWGVKLKEGFSEESCRKVIAYVRQAARPIANAVLDCDDADTVKQELLLNLRMVELSEQTALLKLLRKRNAPDGEQKYLLGELMESIGQVEANYSNVWKVRSRPVGDTIFLGTLRELKEGIQRAYPSGI